MATFFKEPHRQKEIPLIDGVLASGADVFWADHRPMRRGNDCTPFVDGKEAMAAIAASLEASTKTIWITGWGLTPKIELVRGPVASEGTVMYRPGTHVSDAVVREKLQEIAAHFGSALMVTSGDRGHVPKGGSTTSLHLAKRAADFHVEGVADRDVFLELARAELAEGGYEVIWHGPHTATSGPHVHLGCYADGRPTRYKIEGETPAGRGRYPVSDPSKLPPPSPAFALPNPAGPSMRLIDILERAARRGVQVRILLWDSADYGGLAEYGVGVDNQDTEAETELEARHPGIRVLRSMPSTTWSNHQKTVVVDAETPDAVAYLGGIDLFLGRYDTPAHTLTLLGDLRGYDDYNPCIPFDEPTPRASCPRMPWHDVHLRVRGPTVADVAANFVERWNNLRKPWFAKNEDPVSFDGAEPPACGHFSVQIVRSISEDSGSDGEIERGILEAYLKAIINAQHFVYIENQYFESSCAANTDVVNQIAGAIRERIHRAHLGGHDFHVFLVLPQHPEGPLWDDALDVRNASVLGTLRRQLHTIRDLVCTLSTLVGECWKNYLSIYCLRAFRKLGDRVVTEQIYVHAKLVIVDDRVVIVGSANINDRSLLGDHDSELSAVVIDEQVTTARLHASTQNVRPFARELRRRLMREHFAQDVEDPVAQHTTLRAIGNRNRAAYEAAFPFLPSNTHTTLAEMRAASRVGDMSALARVRGHALLYPLQWLSLMEEPGTPEKLAPKGTYSLGDGGEAEVPA